MLAASVPVANVLLACAGSAAEAYQHAHCQCAHSQCACVLLPLQAQQQKQLPAGQKEQQQEGQDVCSVIADDAMRQRCRDLLTDILGTTSDEQQGGSGL